MKKTKVAFIGNQDNMAVFLCDSLNKNNFDSTVFLCSKDISDERSNPEEFNNKNQKFKIVKLSENLTKKHRLKRQEAEKINQYDIVFISGKYAPTASSQIKKPACYLPVGSHEVLKYKSKKFKDIFINFLKKITCRKSSNRLRQAILSVKHDLALKRFSRDLRFVCAKTNHETISLDLVDWCKQAFPLAKILECPEPFPRFEFTRSQYCIDTYNKLYKKYQQYEVLFFAPSRKWIVPDVRTGYSKHTDWILRAFDKLQDKGLLDPQKCRIIWFDHGQDSESCRQHIENAKWQKIVDFYPHQRTAKLWAFMRLDNTVILDEFGDKSWPVLGGAMRESLAFQTPVLTSSFDPNSQEQITRYGGVPLLYCPDEQSLFFWMTKCLTQRNFIKQMRIDIEQWELAYNPQMVLTESLNRIISNIQNTTKK